MPNSADIDDLFLQAIRLPRSERTAFVDECTPDSQVRNRLKVLLEAHDEAPDFLESPAVHAPALDLTPHSPPAEGPGTTIGRYKLLELIGEGGFGAVYMADQKEPVRRRVALKIIKVGMDTKQVIARFEAERQALAMMDHPNIAKVLDAGATETGRPYFVMELVKGVPITEYCDTQNLTTKQRLDLFIKVCNAVQHAHQKAIIHRDIKPSNVMVTLHDDRPVPKIIDFGIAKATNRELTDKTLFTEFRHFIGTPQYMSPEQAEMSGLDIDTRSDIYSLGVLLYELLTGTTPFDPKRLHSAALNELQRIIREEEPDKPSIRLSEMSRQSGTGVSSVSDEKDGPHGQDDRTTQKSSIQYIAMHRRAEPSALSKLLRGDLDWIVMKAMEKDRTRRYETANALAKDVERHLLHEPVQAGPPGVTYKLGKFMKRNRAGVAAGVAIAAAVVIGLVTSTVLYIRSEASRAEADSQRSIALQEKRSADQARDEAVHAREAESHLRRIAIAQLDQLRRSMRVVEIPGAADASSKINPLPREATTKAEINPAILAAFKPLPEQMVSEKNPITPGKIDLGRKLFYEKRLSKSQRISCNSCHSLKAYGVDSKRFSTGHKQQEGDRNAPTVYNAAGHLAQFWDGRAADVEEQAKSPILNPIEMAMPDEASVVKMLNSIPGYVEAFKKAYPDDNDPVTFDHMAQAIGAFERELVTPSRWDKFLNDDEAALTDAEKAGFNKFVETGCSICHQGTYVGGNLYNKLGIMKPWPDNKDLGRYQVTKTEADKFFFKVPSLRNVEMTGPYLHNGSIEDLETVVSMMAEYQLGRKISDEDIRSIITFLKTLTGEIPLDYITRPELPASGPNTPKRDLDVGSAEPQG